MAPDTELISTMADWRGQLPRADQEGEHKTDQEVIEEFQRVADDGRGEDLDLVAGQTRLSIEYLEHGVFPLALVRFFKQGLAPNAPGSAAKLSCEERERKSATIPKTGI